MNDMSMIGLQKFTSSTKQTLLLIVIKYRLTSHRLFNSLTNSPCVFMMPKPDRREQTQGFLCE